MIAGLPDSCSSLKCATLSPVLHINIARGSYTAQYVLGALSPEPGPSHPALAGFRCTRPEVVIRQTYSLLQQLQHRSGGAQIQCLETFGESLVYRREESYGVAGPILPHPQAGKAESAP